MRMMICLALLCLLTSDQKAQEKPSWQRLYTYDDSAVELDAANVTFGSAFTGRVRVRFSYEKTQPPTRKGGARYKSVVETMECRCDDRLYRVVRVERFDGKGNCVEIDEADANAEWKPASYMGMRSKMFSPACNLIYEKKRNP